MRKQSGAALTEFVILMLVMIPLMYGIPMIGKLIDLRQTTVQASRYSAWEGTVKSDVTAPRDVKARFFSDHSVSLGADASEANVLWGGSREGDQNGQQTRERVLAGAPSLTNMWLSENTTTELDEQTGAAVAYSSAYDSGAEGLIAKQAETAVNTILDATGSLTRGDWIEQNSATKGLLRAAVRADVKGNGLFETLSFNDATVIMHDNWSAENDDVAAKRARTMVPSGALETVGNLISNTGHVPFFWELKNLDDAFGHVDTDHLPESESTLRVLKQYEE